MKGLYFPTTVIFFQQIYFRLITVNGIAQKVWNYSESQPIDFEIFYSIMVVNGNMQRFIS
jgi:hypothetical protein